MSIARATQRPRIIKAATSTTLVTKKTRARRADCRRAKPAYSHREEANPDGPSDLERGCITRILPASANPHGMKSLAISPARAAAAKRIKADADPVKDLRVANCLRAALDAALTERIANQFGLEVHVICGTIDAMTAEYLVVLEVKPHRAVFIGDK
jgi:hypothetical protein